MINLNFAILLIDKNKKNNYTNCIDNISTVNVKTMERVESYDLS